MAESHWAAIEQALSLMESAVSHALGGQVNKATRLRDAAHADFVAAVGEAKRREANDSEALEAYKDERDWLQTRLNRAEQKLGEAKRRESELERKAGIWRAGMRGTSDNAAGLAAERDAAEARAAELEKECELRNEESAAANRLIAELKERVAELERALTNYADHQSWRCAYRLRYDECRCGLDETMEKLGLPLIPVEDPEREKGEQW